MENNEKEPQNNGSGTQTAVAEPKTETGYEGDLKSLMEEGKYNISAPLFLMFAEYLGYVGKTLPWVDNWCVAKKKPAEYQIKFIEIEAVTVLNEAKKKFTIKKLRELYDSLYEVILNIYDANIKELEEKK